jgi:Zn-dependent protease with chaperone function
MRRIVQDSLLSFAFLALTGDSTGVSELFLGFPVVLTELAYSREFERDADQYAMEYLKGQRIEPSRFSDLLARIEKKHGEQGNSESDKWSGYLSTHPPTQERLIPFRKASRKTD